MMRAMQLSYKSSKASEVQIPKPILGPDQILVKVHYAALDTGTDEVLQQRLMGMFIHAKAKKNGPPLVLGWHFTGSVEEFGANVDKAAFKPSDMVWGFLQYAPDQKQGSFSEYISVHVNECAPVPKNVPLEQVAAASTEALTALQAMRDLGNLSAGKSILILGAGGGVGSAAVQIAKNLGAHVTASCSTKDVKRVEDLGADVVIDRGIQDPLATGSKSKYDIIFDAPNKYSAVRAMRVLRPKGSYVVTMLTWSLFAAMLLSIFNGKKAKFIECFSKREDLDLIATWLQEGKLQIDIDSTFLVRNLEQAMARQNDKSKSGRVLVQVQDGWKD